MSLFSSNRLENTIGTLHSRRASSHLGSGDWFFRTHGIVFRVDKLSKMFQPKYLPWLRTYNTAPWWAQFDIQPTGPEIEVTIDTVDPNGNPLMGVTKPRLSFSPEQMAEFGVDQCGEIIDEEKHKLALSTRTQTWETVP